jgi:hypothetical protein
VGLTVRNMPAADLGVLKDMPGIRDKANSKFVLREVVTPWPPIQCKICFKA